jgi:hypothetical protein
MNRPFVPRLINNLDNYLLKNKPNAWSNRTHLVAWYCLLAYLVMGVLIYIFGIDLKEEDDNFVAFIITSIISFIGLIIYLRYLLLFNTFKSFSKASNRWQSLGNFFVYIFNFMLIGGLVIVPLAVQSYKAKIQYPRSQIINDVNKANTIYANYNNNTLKISRTDTLIFEDTVSINYQ